MSVLVVLGVGALGGAGAVARVVVERTVASRHGGQLAIGRLIVNLSGALLLGLLVGATLSGDGLRLLGTGLLGSYTTYGAWMLELDELGRERRFGAAALTLAVSLLGGLALAWAGREVGGLL